jgi:hypothetical protein
MKLSQITVLIIALLFCSCASAQTSDSKIRSVDFANFTYSWNTDLGDADKTFTLKNGEFPATRDVRGMIDEMGVLFGRVKYGDVTGDGVEEAIVFLSIQTGGSSIPGVFYIYTWQNNHPVLLWSRSTGDRADGGFRDAYAEAGNYVLELNSSEQSRGDCCPTKFERAKYKWNGKEFRQTKKEVLSIAESR